MCQADTLSSERRGDRLNDEERIELLRSAEAKVNEAADMVDECLRMAGLGKRFEGLTEELRSLASSKDGDSIDNAVKELEYRQEEQPGWTRPHASVKNSDIKDLL